MAAWVHLQIRSHEAEGKVDWQWLEKHQVVSIQLQYFIKVVQSTAAMHSSVLFLFLSQSYDTTKSDSVNKDKSLGKMLVLQNRILYIVSTRLC